MLECKNLHSRTQLIFSDRTKPDLHSLSKTDTHSVHRWSSSASGSHVGSISIIAQSRLLILTTLGKLTSSLSLFPSSSVHSIYLINQNDQNEARPSTLIRSVIEPHVLQSLLTTNPVLLAVDDLIREQSSLLRSFVHLQRTYYESTIRSIRPDHVYTTKDNTLQVCYWHSVLIGHERNNDCILLVHCWSQALANAVPVQRWYDHELIVYFICVYIDACLVFGKNKTVHRATVTSIREDFENILSLPRAHHAWKISSVERITHGQRDEKYFSLCIDAGTVFSYRRYLMSSNCVATLLPTDKRDSFVRPPQLLRRSSLSSKQALLYS